MGGRILTFADLLAPIRPETFFEQNWENGPLHSQRPESGFHDKYARNLVDETYLLPSQTGIGVLAPAHGPRRSFFAGVTREF